ncbi:MAG: DUF1501 domain-containing protein [Planctomycetota bacterium]|nr:DUF1501 domain-containing protein [Planctomycetota bacterium]
MSEPMHRNLLSRRELLRSASCGFAYLAFAGLSSELAAAESGYKSPLARRVPHFRPHARRVIFLFMQGGPSHVDTFDYKPKLQEDGRKTSSQGQLLPSPWQFQQHGESGLWISELFPRLAQHADDLCLINSMHTDSPAHPQATIMVHTGSINFVRPSVGAWTLYGLGTENQDLPGFITINPLPRLGGAQNYGSAFLPACYQGTAIGGGSGPAVANLGNREIGLPEQRKQLDLLQAMNRDFLGRSRRNLEIEGLIQSYELAFRMQTTVPEVLDIGGESRSTLELYGIGGGLPSSQFGRQCLMARRFAEAGVRYIEICHNGWDQHNRLEQRLTANARATDAGIAGLITDLKQRGLFEDTLLVWGGEFGRTPTAQGKGKDGRRHNNRGYTMWMAGGGVRGGIRHGATDHYGAESVEDKVHIHDLHATILHLLGLDHEKLTYRYAGRDFRLTDVYGNVVKDIVA